MEWGAVILCFLGFASFHQSSGHMDHSSTSSSSTTTTMDIKMPGARPAYADHYLCTAYPVNKGYVVGYKALAEASTAHHILLYACDFPHKYNGVWECGSICRGRRGIMFAWAKNAPPLHLPKDVGYQIGKDADVNYIVMQIHYAHALLPEAAPDQSGIQLEISQQRQIYKAGIYLLMSVRSLPKNTPVIHRDSSCKYDGPATIYPFGFRTHAHSLSRVITGYQYNGSWHEVGKGNPLWPQAFYPVTEKIAIKRGDSVVARCTYNTTGVNHDVFMGSTASDEMCNFYIMYYTDAVKGETSGMCVRNTYPSLVRQIPPDSDQPLPPNPAMDEMAKGHTHHHHHTPGIDTIQEQPAVELPPAKQPEMEAMVSDNDWPADDVEIGQVGGVSTDKDGNVYVFHRASRIWDGMSFNVRNIFQHQDEPIKKNTLLKLDRNGKVLKQWGANQFYMPHGIHVDASGNIWVTDVALHQVQRFRPDSEIPDLVLGVRFEPGSDVKHFCKPADVAVLSNGDFFVADGYCNSRIMKFSHNGTLLGSWGSHSTGEPHQDDGYPPTNTFDVVHSVTVAEDKKLMCACDRQNARIQCYDLDGGFVKQITSPRFGLSLYGVVYCPRKGGILFAISGPSPYHRPLPNGSTVKSEGFTINITSGEITGTWAPNNDKREFSMPHTIAVDSEHQELYVGDIISDMVWKFVPASSITDVKSFEKKGKTVSAVGDVTSSAEVTAKPKATKEESRASIIIGGLLVLPVFVMVVVAVVLRLRSQGKLQCCTLKGGKRSKFNYFTSHKGFDPLSTEDSDHEHDPLNDSDGEDFAIPPKA